MPETLSAEMFGHLAGVSTATVTMQLLKRGIRACFITGARPLDTANASFVAEAYTLRFIPMREDLSDPKVLGDREYPPRKAIEDIAPGQALVIDARGDQRAGTIGDILTLRLHKRGAAAVVSDGPVRDAAAVAATGLPVFCSGAAAPASLNTHFGADLQCPIACGGVAVFPGDVLVGDGDGVVVIPRSLAAEVASGTAEQERLERFLKSRIAGGAGIFGTYPPDENTMDLYNEWLKSQDLR
jgi:regulator of RNase E activity RraA